MTKKKERGRIMKMAIKAYRETKAKMRHPSKNNNTGQPSAKIENNSVAKGDSRSNHVHVPTSKGMKQPTAGTLLNSGEKENALSSLWFSAQDGLKETHALKRKQPTQLKAMLGLVPNTTNKLGRHSDPSSRLKEVDTMKAKHNLDSMKAKLNLDSTLADTHCKSGSISSYTFGKDPPKFQTDKVDQRGSIEINMSQFAKCMSNKRKEPWLEEHPKAINDDSNVEVQVGKKLKESRLTGKVEAKNGSDNLNRVDVDNDTISISKNDDTIIIIPKNGHARVSMSSCIGQQCYSCSKPIDKPTCSKPIDKPTWSGIFKTDDKKYISLDGHLSTKSCEKAWNLSRELLKVVEVKRLPRLKVWPKAWEVSTPSGDDIGIYFFPHEMRQNKGLDQLVREVMENDLALRTIIGEAEVLIFPSILLPNHHQTFQREHYLWGVFKRREDKCVVAKESLNATGSCEKEMQQKVVSHQSNHMLLVEKTNQEMSRMASTVPLERLTLSTNKRTQEVEASHFKGSTNNKGFDLKTHSEEGEQAEVAFVATDVTSFPATHGQIHSSMEQTPSKLMGFVVRKTPKLDRIIREIEQLGALVFAMQGEMIDAGSWAVSKGIAAQKWHDYRHI